LMAYLITTSGNVAENSRIWIEGGSMLSDISITSVSLGGYGNEPFDASALIA
jgi:hypothetical protein